MSRLQATAVKIGAEVNLDPTIIVAAIMALVKLAGLVGICLKALTDPAEIAQAAKDPSIGQRFAMRRAVRQELANRGEHRKFRAVMAAIRSEIKQMPMDDLTELCTECKGQIP